MTKEELINKNKKYDAYCLTDNGVYIGNAIAKTNNTTLSTHNEENIIYFFNLLKNRQFAINKWCNINNIPYNSFINDMCFINQMHDWGKSFKEWQKFIANNDKKAPLRHEFNSFYKVFFKQINRLKIKLNDIKDDKDYMIKHIKEYYYIYLSILAHHNHFSQYYIENYDAIPPVIPFEKKNDMNTFLMLWKRLNVQFNHDSSQANYFPFYKQQIYRYYLHEIDMKSSALNTNNNIKIDEYNAFSFKDIYKGSYTPIQNLILNYLDEDILMIRANTGGGKTYASLLWANYQITTGKADRVIIALPTQFTSNKLNSDISEYVDNSNVLHSNIMFSEKYKCLSPSEKYFCLRSVKLFESPITITTIDQLLIATSLKTEDNKSMMFNLINSCIVIDEADFYDEIVIANIIKLIKVLKPFNIKILIMSATLPDSFVNVFNTYGNLNIKNIIDENSNCNKVKYNINSINTDWYQKLDNIKNKKNALIYCNTISRAIETYNYLSNIINTKETPLILYHSYFLNGDKNNKENEIVNLLGKKAWEEKEPNGIIIMTQIGELSLNISADYILSDIAPLDRLVQRFGRGCRFNLNKVCDIDIVIPQKNNNNFLYPYMDKKKPNIFLKRTIDCITEKSYTYGELQILINNIYNDYTLSNAALYNSETEHNKLLRQYQFFSENKNDESIVNEWKIRNIDGNELVFINDNKFIDDEYNVTKYQFEIDKFYYSLNIPLYRYNQYVKNAHIIKKEIKINNEIRIINVISECFYSKEIGLDIMSLSTSKNII